MRIKKHQILITSALITNIFGLWYLSSLLNCANSKAKEELSQTPEHQKRTFDKSFTIIIREFEDFDNTVSEMVAGLLDWSANMDILVVADNPVYPPLNLPKSNRVHYTVLNAYPENPSSLFKPERLIRSEYVLFVPDGVVSIPKYSFLQMIQILESASDSRMKIVSGGIKQESVQCLNIDFDVLKWSLKYSFGNEKLCTGYKGQQLLLMKTQDFFNLSHPFTRPFPESLFIQTSLHGWKVLHDSSIFVLSLKLHFKDGHNLWKHKKHHKERLKLMYKSFGIKQVIQPDWKTEWYGCSKDTPRCFGTVINDMPEYIYAKRWTPPCCLKNLREILKHVVSIFDKAGVRYWLEGGSLLGAARHGDIIPWDYDTDIGIYKEDIDKCKYLHDVLSGPYVDDKGFVWEKAREGDFMRVQYSEVNHLHIDIFPFYPKNGIMTKDTWFASHRQDTEFPEHFLKPLTKILFAGINASAPNNVKDFLELKFGKGVIENPRYPDQHLVS
ncbi:fukutin-related protein [Lingula anatina]|uniref:Fukutin-related protein n=1 Tax=Lingula anatina TaxID=7574 RepID=A0A1S3ITH8_LINAN|nr:fukutin-related protein [Lingula anatina]|eukprot:XP_013401515.1 fukutin-related protein [Lingula anatina]